MGERDPRPDAIVRYVSESLLGAPTQLSAALPTDGDGLHLRLRPRTWPMQRDGDEPEPASVRVAQSRVADDLHKAMPLLTVAGRESRMDGRPEIAVSVPGDDELRRIAWAAAAARPIPRLLGGLAIILFATKQEDTGDEPDSKRVNM